MPIALATTIIPLVLTVVVLTISASGGGFRTWLAIAVLVALAGFAFVEFLRVSRDLEER